jgi:5-methylcytosine-specific restriction endonuclease McrA
VIFNTEGYIKNPNFYPTYVGRGVLRGVDNALLNKKHMNKALRQLVWNRYIGAKCGMGYCWCCKCTVMTTFDFECGHVVAQSKGGPDTVENLRPICGVCNRSMGTQNLIEFQKKHGFDQQQTFYARFMRWLFFP